LPQARRKLGVDKTYRRIILTVEREFVFKHEGQPESEAFVYTFQSYLLVRNETDIVQGILTTYDRELTQYDYQAVTTPDWHQDNRGIPALGNLDPDTRASIVEAMNDEGIGILNTEIIHHSTFHIPSWYLHDHYGDLYEVLPHGSDPMLHWSLHVFN
jgi:hypothetical protein